MDALDLAMREAERLGFGVSYGKYKAAYPNGSGDVLPKPKRSRIPNKKTIACRRCGVQFVPIQGSQKYCGAECKMMSASERQRRAYREAHGVKKSDEPVTSCAICGSDFAPGDLRMKYCSEECKRKAIHKAQAVYYRRHKERKRHG